MNEALLKTLDRMASSTERDERLAKTVCPACDKRLDAATAGDGSDVLPKPGDVSLCIECGQILRFTSDMSLEIAPDEVLVEIAAIR